MNIQKPLWYFFILLAFPIFFILHGINENTGLIPAAGLLRLTAYYCLVTGGVWLAAIKFIKDSRKAFLLSFIVLLVFFFFGVFKDFCESHALLKKIASYTLILPILGALVGVAAWYIRKSSAPFKKITLFITVLLLVNLIIESGTMVYHATTDKKLLQDFGDYKHELISNIQLQDAVRTPVVFWIILDEYAGAATMRKKFNFHNPLDSVLRSKDFFVADSAYSSYNYTQYSIPSLLDMRYLRGLGNHSVVTYRDIVRGFYAMQQVNTVELLKRKNYTISNFSIHDLRDAPSGYPTALTKPSPAMLIDNQTISGRIQLDIGWNFIHLLSRDKRVADSIMNINAFEVNRKINDSAVKISMAAAYDQRKNPAPHFFMYHFMHTHDPFIYRADGTINDTGRMGVQQEGYIPCVQYMNTIIPGMVDSLKSWYADRELVIIIQGDHGFKFDEKDPLFDEESCNILYAVYCSDKDYSTWDHSLNAVNSFRIFFNKYFKTDFEQLPDHSYNLYYRRR